MAKFKISQTVHSEKVETVRLGLAGAANAYTYTENGKAVKLTAESRYELAVLGDLIEAFQQSSNYPEQGTVEGFAIGGIVSTGYKEVTFDGLQGTPGVGAVVIGDYVVVGTVVARGTALTAPLRVCKATTQGGATPYKARVMSLGDVGTGAVGTVGIVKLF